jgi:hypothetical protein
MLHRMGILLLLSVPRRRDRRKSQFRRKHLIAVPLLTMIFDPSERNELDAADNVTQTQEKAGKNQHETDCSMHLSEVDKFVQVFQPILPLPANQK